MENYFMHIHTGSVDTQEGWKANGGDVNNRDDFREVNLLFRVAEGILDANEYHDVNLASIAAVKHYVFGGFTVHISDAEAKLVLDTCKSIVGRMRAGEIIGSNDYYHDFEKVFGERGDE